MSTLSFEARIEDEANRNETKRLRTLRQFSIDRTRKTLDQLEAEIGMDSDGILDEITPNGFREFLIEQAIKSREYIRFCESSTDLREWIAVAMESWGWDPVEGFLKHLEDLKASLE